MEATGTHPLSAADPLYVLILQWMAACKVQGQTFEKSYLRPRLCRA